MDRPDSLKDVMFDLIDRNEDTIEGNRRLATIGTITGGSVRVDSLGITIPLSDVPMLRFPETRFSDGGGSSGDPFKSETKEFNYKSGARVLMVPVDSGDSYVIIGEVT